ncbi:hypothetical protein BDR04DRAFT_1097183, partial [Suillus decipiens]
FTSWMMIQHTSSPASFGDETRIVMHRVRSSLAVMHARMRNRRHDRKATWPGPITSRGTWGYHMRRHAETVNSPNIIVKRHVRNLCMEIVRQFNES